MKNPNGDAADLVDVVFATTVIGAGYSIETRFVKFHAFLKCSPIDHWQQQQLICRLRWTLHDIGADPTRHSFMYIEKGTAAEEEDVEKRVEVLMEAFSKVRVEIISRAAIEGGEDLEHVRLLTRTQVSDVMRAGITVRNNHDLWLNTGWKSQFNENQRTATEEEEMRLAKRMKDFKKTMRRDITDLMVDLDYTEGDVSRERDVDSELNQIHMLTLQDMKEVMTSAGAETAYKTWESGCKSAAAAQWLVRDKYKNDANTDKMCASLSKPNVAIARAIKLACFIIYRYDLVRDAGDVHCRLLMEDYFNERFKTSLCRRVYGLFLASEILPDVLGGVTPCSAVVVPGQTPFYEFARINKYGHGWPQYWMTRLSTTESDTDEVRDRKKKEWFMLQQWSLLTSDHGGALQNIKMSDLTTSVAYGTPKIQQWKPWALIVQLLKVVGLNPLGGESKDGGPKVACYDNIKRYPWKIERCPHTIALAFLLEKSFANRLINLLPPLMTSDNLGDTAKKDVETARNLYNKSLEEAMNVGRLSWASVALWKAPDPERETAALQMDIDPPVIAQRLNEMAAERQRESEAQEAGATRVRETTTQRAQLAAQRELDDEDEYEFGSQNTDNADRDGNDAVDHDLLSLATDEHTVGSASVSLGTQRSFTPQLQRQERRDDPDSQGVTSNAPTGTPSQGSSEPRSDFHTPTLLRRREQELQTDNEDPHMDVVELNNRLNPFRSRKTYIAEDDISIRLARRGAMGRESDAQSRHTTATAATATARGGRHNDNIDDDSISSVGLSNTPVRKTARKRRREEYTSDLKKPR